MPDTKKTNSNNTDYQFSGTFIGICSLDTIYYVDAFPAPDQKCRAHDKRIMAGGMAANAAAAFSQLGGKSHLVSCFGETFPAQTALHDLQSLGVKITDNGCPDYDFPTSTIISNVISQERAVISSPKTATETNNKTPLHSANLGDIVMIDGFFPDIALPLLKRCRELNIPVVWDADKWRSDDYIDFLPYIDIAICSRDFHPPGCRNEEQVFSFFKDNDIARYAMTNGGAPIKWCQDNRRGEINIHATSDVIDTLGAGDVLHGAFCKFYLQEQDFVSALVKSSQIATTSCRQKGPRLG